MAILLFVQVQFDPRTVQPVASRYTDYATQPTIRYITDVNCG